MAGPSGAYQRFTPLQESPLSIPSINALFKEYMGIVKTNGDLFFARGQLSKERVTRMLGEQMLVTDELCKRIQDSSDREFQQFLRWLDISVTGLDNQAGEANRAEPSTRTGSFSGNVRLTPATTHDSVKQGHYFDLTNEVGRPKIPFPMFDGSVFPGFVPSRLPPTSVLETGSFPSANEQVATRDPRGSQDLPAAAVVQSKSPGPTAHYFRYLGAPN